MTSQEPTLAARFMSSFNDIEDHFRSALRADYHEPFTALARRYADKTRTPRAQREALSAFAALRNAIAHGRYHDGQPIAEPNVAVVRQIEALRDQVLTPPSALSSVPTGAVSKASPTDQISIVLTAVRAYGYSQFPVYDGTGYVWLLTTNAIARWLANQMDTEGGFAIDAPVADVAPFVEHHEVARLVPRNTTASQAIDLLSTGGPGSRPALALLVTHNGNRSEQPLAVVVADDLPALMAAVAIT